MSFLQENSQRRGSVISGHCVSTSLLCFLLKYKKVQDVGTRPWYSLDTFDQNKIILIAKLELICLWQKMFNEYNYDYRVEYFTIQHWTNVEIHVLSQFFKLVAKLLVVSSSSLWSNNGHATEMSGGNLYEADSQDFKSFGFYDLIYQWMQSCLCQEVKRRILLKLVT